MFFEFKERWVRPKLNLAALVTMREQGMSLREISRVTGVPRTSLKKEGVCSLTRGIKGDRGMNICPLLMKIS